MGGPGNRIQPRYQVHLTVRFEKALDFVTEYAENLSRGGLFVRGAHHLELDAEVPIQLEMPGYDPFKVVARVAHVITPSIAKTLKRKPGAGFHIVRGPKGFQDAIREYLSHLGRRRDHAVLGGDHHIAGALEQSGYQTRLVPGPEALADTLQELDVRVLGVVVNRNQEPAFVVAAHAAGRDGLVHGIDFIGDVEELLPKFDAQL